MNKQWPVLEPTHLSQTVNAPERLTAADIIEVRVQLTPLRWHEASQTHEAGERMYVTNQFVQIEARDHRAVFCIMRQILEELFRRYMGLEVGP